MTNEELQDIISQAMRHYPHRLDLIEKIIEYFYPVVRRQALIRLGDPFLADDVTQEVFGRLLRSFRHLKSPKAFRSYLYKMTLNEIRRAVKRRKLQEDAVEPQSLERMSEKDSLPNSEWMQSMKIREILSRLKPHYAKILELYYLYDMSVSELADALRLSPSAIKMRLKRGREQFARLWNES